jgi:FtsH-binding integral membrane protein
METNNFDNNLNYVQSQEETTTMSRTFLANVFSWMAAALVITSVVAYYFAYNTELASLLVNQAAGRLSILGYVVVFSPLLFPFAISFGFNRLSYPVLLSLFLLFSIVMGASLSFIFAAYTSSSIYAAFIGAAGMFTVMAVLGYTTQTDLTKFGSLLMIGFFCIIGAMLINMLLESNALDYLISAVGIVIFTGLTAYKVQMLKRIGAGQEFGTEETNKLVIMGALTLYITFINLFLSLLRVFGNRK